MKHFVLLRHFILVLLLMLLGGAALAQAPAFDQAVVLPDNAFGGVGTYVYGGRSAPDAQGNTYEAGYYDGTATFGSFTLGAAGHREVFVTRRNAAGVYQWAVRVGGNGNVRLDGFEVDAAGEAVIAGSFEGRTATFGPYTLTNAHATIPNAYDRPDVFVAKISAAGTWQWANSAGGGTQTGADDLVTDLLLDGAGNAYVSGTFDGPTARFGGTVLTNPGPTNIARTEVFVAKLNAAGAWQWAVQGAGPGNDGDPYLAFTAGGDLLVTGYMYNLTGTFGNVTITNPTGGVFVAKLTAAGVWQWAASASGLDNCTGLRNNGRALEDANGNIYVKGLHSSAAVTFGSTTLPYVPGQVPPFNPCRRLQDIYVAKLNASGAWQWALTAGGAGDDGISSLAVDDQGNVYMTGSLGGPTAQFGGTTLSNASTPFVSTDGILTFPGDVYVAKANAAGVFQWAVSAGGSGNDGGSEVAIDGAGCLTVKGYFTSPQLTLGATTLRLGSGASYSFFSARLGCRPLATTTAAKPASFTLHPNPSPVGAARLTWQLPSSERAARAVVYSVLGQPVSAVALPGTAAGTAELPGLAAGMYMVRLLGADGGPVSAAQRLVVE